MLSADALRRHSAALGSDFAFTDGNSFIERFCTAAMSDAGPEGQETWLARVRAPPRRDSHVDYDVAYGVTRSGFSVR